MKNDKKSIFTLLRSKHLFVYKVYLLLLHIKFNFYLIPLRSNKALHIAQNILTMGPKYLQTKATHTPNFFLLSSEQSVYVCDSDIDLAYISTNFDLLFQQCGIICFLFD